MNSWIIPQPDSVLSELPDSTLEDSVVVALDTLPIGFADSDLRDVLNYKARDSMVYDLANELILLYGEADVKYTDITLRAYYIEYNWQTNVLSARGLEDSLGKIVEGKPVFTQGDKTFSTRQLKYNFKTKKGKLYELYTQEGEGYIQSPEVKKDEHDNLYARNALYTTCELEHPHFYIEATPLKIVPNRIIVTGPANLVIEDVRTPLALPFAIFPMRTGQRSGLIIPAFGQTSTQGFSLTEGGYYLGISEYLDARITGDVYTNGSWRLRALTNFRKRYRYNGNISFQYGSIRTGSELEGTLATSQDFKIAATFAVDPNALPNSSFSANVNFVTSSFNQFNDFTYTDHLSNNYSSSIQYSKRWPGKPFNFSVNLRHSQNTSTNLIDFTLPQTSFGISKIYPFKRKVVQGKTRWYEKIGVSYLGQAQNRVTVADSMLFKPGFLSDSRVGAKHTIPVSASLKLFKYFSVTPSFNYTEIWYDERYDRTYNPDPVDSTTFVVVDTMSGFNTARFFDMGISFNTRVYGRLNFKKGKLKAIRHVVTPNVSANYRPDFGGSGFNYYQQLQQDTLGNEGLFYRYPSNLYGAAPSTPFGGLSFGLQNNLEAKVFSKKDTVNNEKKIRIIESLRASGSYNFVLDSLQLSLINISGNTTLFDRIGVNYSATYDPYALNAEGARVDKFELKENKRLARLETARLSLTSSFRSKPRRPQRVESQPFYSYPGEPIMYADFNFPWQVNLGYNLVLNKGFGAALDSVSITQSLSASVSFSPTPQWNVSAQTGYDFVNNELTYTTVQINRDLHCWEMKFRWIPLGTLRSYTFALNVKSSVLKDLKIEKKSDPIQNF